MTHYRFRHSRATLALAAAALLAAPPPVLAWGKNGHRITATIAEAHVSGKTRARVHEILGGEGLPEASNWPDEMRSSDEEFWQKTASPWHYVTVPDGENYAALAHPPQGDAAKALDGFARTLRDPAAAPLDKALALRFAVHIIGDLHQPFHVGRGDDRGGNDVKILWFGEPANLHALWDEALLEHQRLSYSEYAALLTKRTSEAQLLAWWTDNPQVIISEGQALRGALYPPKTADGSPPALSWKYEFQHKRLMEDRLAAAGVRIAAWLEKVFD